MYSVVFIEKLKLYFVRMEVLLHRELVGVPIMFSNNDNVGEEKTRKKINGQRCHCVTKMTPLIAISVKWSTVY